MSKEIRGLHREEALIRHYALSEPSRRFLAGLFDFSVLVLIDVIILVPGLLVFVSSLIRPSLWQTITVYVVMFVSGALFAAVDITYRVAIPYFYGGETLGYRFYRMRIYMENGSSATLKAILLRALAGFFLALLTFGLYYLVELCAIALGSTKRTFVDVVTQTIVADDDDA